MRAFLSFIVIAAALGTFAYAATSDRDCSKARSQIESERQTYQKIQSGEKSRRFYTGTSPWYAIIPEDLEYVWKAVDGGLPKSPDQYGGPSECRTVWSKGTFQDYEKCAWGQYISRLEKLAAACSSPQKTDPAVQKQQPVKSQTRDEKGPFLFENVKRLMEAKFSLQKAIQEIAGKDAFLVVRDTAENFHAINNKGKQLNIPASLSNKLAFSNKPALLPPLIQAEELGDEIKKKEATLEDAFNEHIRTFFPDGYKNIASTYIAASYFSMDEFWAGAVEALCKAIAKDGYRITLQKPDNSIERLNELLQIPGFYDIWREKSRSVLLNNDAEKLVYETQNYRRKEFSKLSESEAKNIIKLNRLILEATYQSICPKSRVKIKYKKSPISESEYMTIKDNFYQFYVLGISVLASSEHGSIKGTINGGGDFIYNFRKRIMLASFEDHDNSTARDFVKAPIVLAASSPPEYVFIRTPSAHMTLAGRAVVDLGYNGETGLHVLEGRARVKESVTGSEREVPAGSVVYVIPGFGISRTVNASEIKINRWWEGRERPVMERPVLKDTQAAGQNFAGSWIMEDAINRMAGSLTLTQTDSRVQGTATLGKGTVRVEGSVAGNELQLIFIHDNVPGLTNFIQEDVARQIVGITSKAAMRLDGGRDKIEGTYYGWQVYTDNSNRVTARYEGGTQDAIRVNAPRAFRLTRKVEPSVITLKPGEVWTGRIPAARTLELDARILYSSAAGGAHALEIQVNGRLISNPLINKGQQFRFADGRTFAYYDQGRQSWLLFYSPDFTTNDTARAGGYQVVTNPGQSYKYVWDISSLTGGAAEYTLSIRHSFTGTDRAIEVRIKR